MSRSSEKPCVDFIVNAWVSQFEDTSAVLPNLRRDFERDIERCRARIQHEGIAFLTQVLPAWGYAYLKWLDASCSYDLSVVGWRPKKHFRWAVQGYSASNLPPVDVVAFFIQICLFGAKLHASADGDVERRCLSAFKDRALSAPSMDSELLTGARRLCKKWFAGYRPRRFSHGRGSDFYMTCAYRISTCRYVSQSEQLFPAKEFFFGGDGLLYTAGRVIHQVPYYRSKVVSVPKSSTSVRIIAIEEPQAMLIQQSIMNFMYDRLESVGCRIRTGSQDHMRSLLNDDHVTFDLSNASDSISQSTVFSVFEDLSPFLEACRSRELIFPDSSRIRPEIYGTMGNATTFPVMTALILSTLRSQGVDANVFGDDIIVPRYAKSATSSILTSAGFSINPRKSYCGLVKESCGELVYAGVCITPTYLRAASSAIEDLFSLCATANQLVTKFMYRTAEVLFGFIEQRVGRLPCTGNRDVGLLSRQNPRLPGISGKTRWNPDYQCVQIKGPCLVEISRRPYTKYVDHWRYVDTLVTGQPSRSRVGVRSVLKYCFRNIS